MTVLTLIGVDRLGPSTREQIAFGDYPPRRTRACVGNGAPEFLRDETRILLGQVVGVQAGVLYVGFDGGGDVEG